jgi:hypothetical protein
MSQIILTVFVRLLLYIVPAFKERKPCAETKDGLLVCGLLYPYNATKRIIMTANLFRSFSVFVFLTADQNVCFYVCLNFLGNKSYLPCTVLSWDRQLFL